MKSRFVTSFVVLILCCSTLDTMAQQADTLLSKATLRRIERIKERSIIKDQIVLEKHHSIRLGYGGAAPFYKYQMKNPADYSVQHYYRGGEMLSGVIFAEYSYRPLRWIETGLNVSYINSTQQYFDRLNDAKLGYHTLNTLGFAAHVRFSYLTRPIVRLYSGLAIGVAVGFEQMKLGQQIANQTSTFFNGSVTLLGVTVGRRLYGFFELGVGTMGVCNFGIGYRFATK